MSLVSLGEARGHNKQADQKTLEQVRDCAKQYKGGLRVKFNPYTFNHGDGSLAGYIAPDSIQVKDNQVIGDMHVYGAFPHKDYLYEIAERAPDNFGLSIEFNGDTEQIGENFFARCDEIFAATVVDLPAANPTGLFAAKDEESLTKIKAGITDAQIKQNKQTAMTDEEIAKLTKGITEGIKPLFETFRMQQGNGSGDPATEEEMAAAGCTDDMTPEDKQAKVNEWRKKADTPLTKKDLLQFFRMTGGAPTKVSGGKGAEKNEGEFASTVRKYRETGMGESKAIARAAHDDRKGYNEWCKAGRPTITL